MKICTIIAIVISDRCRVSCLEFLQFHARNAYVSVCVDFRTSNVLSPTRQRSLIYVPREEFHALCQKNHRATDETQRRYCQYRDHRCTYAAYIVVVQRTQFFKGSHSYRCRDGLEYYAIRMKRVCVFRVKPIKSNQNRDKFRIDDLKNNLIKHINKYIWIVQELILRLMASFFHSLSPSVSHCFEKKEKDSQVLTWILAWNSVTHKCQRETIRSIKSVNKMFDSFDRFEFSDKRFRPDRLDFRSFPADTSFFPADAVRWCVYVSP